MKRSDAINMMFERSMERAACGFSDHQWFSVDDIDELFTLSFTSDTKKKFYRCRVVPVLELINTIFSYSTAFEYHDGEKDFGRMEDMQTCLESALGIIRDSHNQK